MEILNRSLQSIDIPNLLLYGYDINDIQKRFYKILKKYYTINSPEKIITKGVTYEKTNLYYEFNMKLMNQNMDAFIEIIQEIVYSKNYFGEYANKIILLTNFSQIKNSLQNILRVYIEKYRQTTVFIILTDKYDGIIDPIQSRCLSIRFPILTSSEKRKIIYKNMKSSTINTELYDHVYEIHSESTINEFLNYNFILDSDFKTLYEFICQKIISLYRHKKYTKITYEKIREYSYNILKFNLNVRHFYYIFLSNMLKENILDKKKCRLIYLFAESEYNYNQSYRSIIILESLLFNVFKIYRD